MTAHSDEDLLRLLEGFERRLLHLETRRSKAELDALLADDFIEFGSSGRRYDKAEAIAAPPAETRKAEVSAWDFALRRLAPDVALLTFRTASPSASGIRHVWRSSVWCGRARRWQVVFHQGTPTTEM